MDMRKLIDETDFDNINELSKRWKKEANGSSLGDSKVSATSDRPPENILTKQKNAISKENIHHKSNVQEISQVQSASDNFKKKRQVVPQIIDSDTEHFRNRLEYLLNGFKMDAVNEFMSMKRTLLEYQNESIKNDTQKYLTMYEQKHQQLLQTKQKMNSMTSDLERKTMQIELMSLHIAKLNERIKINKYLSRPFAFLYENKLTEKMLKVKMEEARRYSNRRVLIQSFSGWRGCYQQTKKQSEKTAIGNKIELQVKEIVGRFQKQMETLKQKLNESTKKNHQYEKSMHLMQDNLKKAFLRGLSSMNMEAMNIFGSNEETGQAQTYSPQKNLHLQHLPVEHDISVSRNPNNLSLTRQKNQQTVSNYGNKSLFLNQPKIESKDHKWKEAPIMGVEQRRECQEPRPHLIKPTVEAKVIRVVDGKSSVENTSQKQIVKKNVGHQNVVSNKLEGSKKKM